MAKRLFICNTPYQIIIATILSNNLGMEKDQNGILITDNFVNGNEIYEKNNALNFYNYVYYAKVNDWLFPRDIKNRIKKIKYFLNPDIMYTDCVESEAEHYFKYDEVYYNNDDLFFYNVINICTRNNKNLKVYRFEEGYSSYLSHYCSRRGKILTDIRNFIMMRKPFSHYYAGAYFFEPELVQYQSDKLFFHLSRDIDKTVQDYLVDLFNVSSQYNDIAEHWIVFEESFYMNSDFSEDLELYKTLANMLGDDLVVKLHPRGRINRFRNLGIKTFQNDGVPWEAVLMSGGVKDKKFVTLASGSVINAKLLLGDRCESWLLYKCINKSKLPMNLKFEQFINALISSGIAKNVYVPDSISEFDINKN